MDRLMRTMWYRLPPSIPNMLSLSLSKMVAVIFNSLLFASCLFALWRGGLPERTGAAMLLTAAILTYVVVDPRSSYRHAEWGVFIIDAALLIGLVGLSLRANRYWPLWLAAMQMVTTWSHLGAGMLSQTKPLAYAIASVAWSFPMLILLAAGTYRHRLRRVKFGNDQDWTDPLS